MSERTRNLEAANERLRGEIAERETIAEALRIDEGWVAVISQPNQGSTFKVNLPVSEVKDASVEIKSDRRLPGAVPARGTQRILVVEDEPSLRLLVGRILEKGGYRIVLAGDGVEAVDIWRRERGNFDLLLTDIVMPKGISGTHLARILQTENALLKVIFTSGYSDEVVDRHGDLREGHNFLSKPYMADRLLQMVRSRLDA